MGDSEELAEIMARLRSGHDVVPFLTRHYPVAGMQLRLMPGEMQAVLEAAPDYQPVDRGKGPVWIQVASDDDAAELVVYRTTVTGSLYVVAPANEPEF